jgi:hypothetical protein
MIQRAEQLIEEIRQISKQYSVEVGSKRRPWPKAIKSRVAELDELGVSRKAIAADTGVPYHTVLQWRYQRNKKFHELKLPAVATVTVPQSDEILKNGTVTVTTPDGYRVELSTPKMAVEFLRMLRGG